MDHQSPSPRPSHLRVNSAGSVGSLRSPHQHPQQQQHSATFSPSVASIVSPTSSTSYSSQFSPRQAKKPQAEDADWRKQYRIQKHDFRDKVVVRTSNRLTLLVAEELRPSLESTGSFLFSKPLKPRGPLPRCDNGVADFRTGNNEDVVDKGKKNTKKKHSKKNDNKTTAESSAAAAGSAHMEIGDDGKIRIALPEHDGDEEGEHATANAEEDGVAGTAAAAAAAATEK